MVKERGNYNNACAVYARHYLNKRLTNWVTAERRLYNKFLAAKTKVIFANGEKSFHEPRPDRHHADREVRPSAER